MGFHCARDDGFEKMRKVCWLSVIVGSAGAPIGTKNGAKEGDTVVCGRIRNSVARPDRERRGRDRASGTLQQRRDRAGHGGVIEDCE